MGVLSCGSFTRQKAIFQSISFVARSPRDGLEFMTRTSRNGKRRCVATVAVLSLAALSACANLGLVTESDFASTSAVPYMDAARRSNGLPTAAPDAQLDQAALEQARYMAAAGEMTHTTRRGRD